MQKKEAKLRTREGPKPTSRKLKVESKANPQTFPYISLKPPYVSKIHVISAFYPVVYLWLVLFKNNVSDHTPLIEENYPTKRTPPASHRCPKMGNGGGVFRWVGS